MNRIHVARNQRSIGQFSPEEVAERLASGNFLPTDLAWCEPMESWQPLSTFTDLPVVELPVVPPPLPDDLPTPAVAEPPRTEPAWERRQEIGLMPAVSQTLRQVLSDPSATFRAMKLDGGFGAPLGFFLLVYMVTNLAVTIYSLSIVIFYPQAMAESFPREMSASTLAFYQIAGLFISPIVAVAGAFISAGVLHLIFSALGAGSQPFEATFRAWCYAMSGALVFQLIPFCGVFITLTASVVLVTIALREVHRADGAIAALGVVLPALMCGGLLTGLYVLAQSLASHALLK